MPGVNEPTVCQDPAPVLYIKGAFYHVCKTFHDDFFLHFNTP